MNEIKVAVIQPSDTKALRQFVSLERSLLSKHPRYISDIDSDVIQFLTRQNLMAKEMEFALFMVTAAAGKVVGRCAAIINKKFQAQKQADAGFIGFFAADEDCEREVTVMMSHAEQWLAARDVHRIIAPANGGAPNPMGLLVNAFDEDPMFPFPWTPPYYRSYFEHMNYQPAYPLWYYSVDFSSEAYQAAKRKYANYDGAVIRPVSKKNWDQDITIVADLLNESFIHEWEFARVSHEEMKVFMKPMKDVLSPEQITIAEVAGEPAGFCFAVPDLTPLFRSFQGKIGLSAILKLLTGATKKFSRAGILGIGVKEEYKGKGLAKAIAIKMYSYHESLGLKSSMYFPVNESNAFSRGFAESIGGTGRLMYQVYDKRI